MTLIKRSLTGRIPTNEAYAYLEVNVAGETENSESFYQEALPEIETLFAKYGNKPLAVKTDGVWEKKTTFTNEEILYDPINHIYKDLEGNILCGASTYKKLFEKPFPTETASQNAGKAWGCEPSVLVDIWNVNGNMSTGWGSVLHKAMEQYWRYKDMNFNGNKPYLSKNPILRGAVESFPEPEGTVLPEIFISCVAKKRAGQVDGLLILDAEKKIAKIRDYKTDAELGQEQIEADIARATDPAEIKTLKVKLKKAKDKLRIHFIQLSFYADILKAFGWTIEGLEIWNYTSEWKVFESPVLDLEELEAELVKKSIKK
jgi:hypothetical protein